MVYSTHRAKHGQPEHVILKYTPTFYNYPIAHLNAPHVMAAFHPFYQYLSQMDTFQMVKISAANLLQSYCSHWTIC